MSYQITADFEGRFAIEFEGEPHFIRGLRMAPDRIEPELMTGDWLLLTFAVWDAYERKSIDAAVGIAKEHAGRFSLGVRPFESFEEFEAWLHPLAGQVPKEASRVPCWHRLNSGEIVATHFGPLDAASLDALIRRVPAG
ncbi:hypothetical protein [Paludisphaera soli]|uniref:hypothetical protein n=1 Tax=Paludisphaera soli TaxID=2712865 RepID=UPI0013EBE4FF|nr:hypothetical protein [Paludisphaera soli]